jgi:hypothetical protein
MQIPTFYIYKNLLAAELSLHRIPSGVSATPHFPNNVIHGIVKNIKCEGSDRHETSENTNSGDFYLREIVKSSPSRTSFYYFLLINFPNKLIMKEVV